MPKKRKAEIISVLHEIALRMKLQGGDPIRA
jgi:hypothetical protein